MRSELDESRPELSETLTGEEFRAWYWLKEELVEFAREVGISTSGLKREIEGRIADHLNGRIPHRRSMVPRRIGAMPEEFRRDTVIGEGWRCGPALGRFFRAELGNGFRFNAAVREFIHTGNGKTLAEAAICYQNSVSPARERGEIPEQLEYNRHFREYFKTKPRRGKRRSRRGGRSGGSGGVDSGTFAQIRRDCRSMAADNMVTIIKGGSDGTGLVGTVRRSGCRSVPSRRKWVGHGRESPWGGGADRRACATSASRSVWISGKGNAPTESDLDLAVILRNFDQQREKPPLRRSDLSGNMSIDLLVVGEERHEFMKDSIISVHHYIASEGVTLYDERVGSIDPRAVTRVSRRLGDLASADQ